MGRSYRLEKSIIQQVCESLIKTFSYKIGQKPERRLHIEYRIHIMSNGFRVIGKGYHAERSIKAYIYCIQRVTMKRLECWQGHKTEITQREQRQR